MRQVLGDAMRVEVFRGIPLTEGQRRSFTA